MKKVTLLFAAAALLAGSASAQTFGNPKDKDGNYIVKWDPVKQAFAESNDFEIDETIIFAIDVTGTGFETPLAGSSRNPAVLGRGMAFDIYTTSAPEGTTGKMNIDGRLMHIKDNVYGMTVNFFQQHTTRYGDAGLEPNADFTEYACCTPGYVVTWNGNFFPFGWAADNPGAEWWDGIATPIQGAFPFACAPYTGTKTSAEFFYGDLGGENECPWPGLDPGAAHSMCDNWGGYAAPENYEAAASVTDITVEDAETVGVNLFNLQGQKLNAEPDHGMFIRQELKANGAVKAVKVVK